MAASEIRWIQRFDNFKRAFACLNEARALALARDLSDLERQGLIQAFEFTHELAWNTIKDFLAARGATEKIYGSKDATRAAFSAGLIPEGEIWMNMIQHRNESSHTYNNDVAGEIMKAVLESYVPEFVAFQQRFENIEAGEIL